MLSFSANDQLRTTFLLFETHELHTCDVLYDVGVSPHNGQDIKQKLYY